jgi:uncharacterized membrane protein
MSDPNEPPRPGGQSDGSGDGSGDAPPPPPPPPPSGDSPYGTPAGSGAYGDGGYGDGGYGAPPPPPPGESPYGQPGSAAYSPTDAIGYGWNKFKASPSTLLVPTLVIGVVVIVVSVVIRLIVVNGMTSSGSSFGAVLFAAAVASAITSLISQVLAAGLYKGGLSVTDGHSVSFGGLFDGWDKMQVVVAAIIIGVLTLIGTILCYLPALIVGYFTQFTFLFIIDKNMSAMDALRASFRLCLDNLGPTILWSLLAFVCILVGAIVCLVGLLVAVPVVLVGLAYTYRRLQNEPVAPA